MRRANRIIVLVLIAVAAILIMAGGGMSAVLSRTATREVNKFLASLPEGEASCGEIQVSLLTGTAHVKDVRFSYRAEVPEGDQRPGMDVRIGCVEVAHVLFSIRKSRSLAVSSIRLEEPGIELWMDEKDPEGCLPSFMVDSTAKPLQIPFQRISLDKLLIDDASFALHSTRTPLDVAVNNCSLSMQQLSYDSAFHFNDSVYSFSLKQAAIRLQDGRSRFITHDIRLQGKGILSVGATQYINITAQTHANNLPGADIRIKRLEVGPLSHSQLFNGELIVQAIKVYQPYMELWMDEEHLDLCFPRTKEGKAQTAVILPFHYAELRHMLVSNASLALHSTRTQLDVVADSCSLAVHDLSFDNTFHYNDTSYSFSLAHAAVTLPDGSMKMQTRDIAHRDQGEVRIGPSRIVHNMEKKALGDKVQEPVTWIDMHLQSVMLSPLNPIRKALNKDYTIQHVDAEVCFMDIFRDERYKLKHATVMPQRILMDLPMTFHIQHADARMQRIHIGFAITDTHVGNLDLGDINARVEHITNRPGYTMRLDGSCPIGKGIANARFDMTMNNECSFLIQLKGKGLNTSFLNGFTRPFAGITSDCRIDSIYTSYTGNNYCANGSFRMVYHNFSMNVNKDDDIPFEIITKHAGVITRVGNALVPKNNPPTRLSKPRGYQVAWTRDDRKPVELYLFGPIIDGVKKTFLPGLYIHLCTKEGEIYD